MTEFEIITKKTAYNSPELKEKESYLFMKCFIELEGSQCNSDLKRPQVSSPTFRPKTVLSSNPVSQPLVLKSYNDRYSVQSTHGLDSLVPSLKLDAPGLYCGQHTLQVPSRHPRAQ